MTRRILTRLALAQLLLLLLAPAAVAGGEAALFFGQKSLDLDVDPAIDSIEDQSEIGVLLTFGSDWPVSLAVDIFTSDESASGAYTYDYYGYTYSLDATFDVDVTELNLGVRKHWGQGRVEGYVGGGAAVVQGELTANGTFTSPFVTEVFSETDDDTGFGYWVNAGVVVRLGRRFNVGVDARLSGAEVTLGQDLDAEDYDVGGTHIGAFVGFRWGQ